MSKSKLPLLTALSVSVLLSTTVSCNQSAPAEETAEETVVEEIEVAEAEDAEESKTVVREHHINEVPVTKKSKSGESTEMKESVKEENSKTALDRQVETDNEYEVTTHEELHASLQNSDYVHLDEITITETIIPLGETETVVSYSRKGKVKDTLQVVTNGNGEVQHIIFTHKHHKDEYDVAVGMSEKEVKNLRKDMKRMEKHGKVFLYSETSNVMYVLTATNESGDRYSDSKVADNEGLAAAEVDEMKVQAIVWKDKKHHAPSVE